MSQPAIGRCARRWRKTPAAPAAAPRSTTTPAAPTPGIAPPEPLRRRRRRPGNRRDDQSLRVAARRGSPARVANECVCGGWPAHRNDRRGRDQQPHDRLEHDYLLCLLVDTSAVEVRVEDPHLGDSIDRQLIARGRLADRLGTRRVVDAERPVLSSLTNELIQVTPSSALRSTTARQTSAPPLPTGIWRPSGKVRCTTYLGISPSGSADECACRQPTHALAPAHRQDHPCWPMGPPILGAGRAHAHAGSATTKADVSPVRRAAPPAISPRTKPPPVLASGSAQS